jgi:hypothetical protein
MQALTAGLDEIGEPVDIKGATAPPLKLTADEQAQLRARLGLPPS